MYENRHSAESLCIMLPWSNESFFVRLGKSPDTGVLAARPSPYEAGEGLLVASIQSKVKEGGRDLKNICRALVPGVSTE